MNSGDRLNITPATVFNTGVFVGVGLVAAGVGLVSVPAALVVTGLLVLALTLHVAHATGLVRPAGK